ncbi:hypothetical protein BR93DRAFT_931630 [Coniochaeta sp. PMI_546]|nr:hypothetical protein BR93DRAFT_931630 [Coniochaeta sp. PMI_546]
MLNSPLCQPETCGGSQCLPSSLSCEFCRPKNTYIVSGIAKLRFGCRRKSAKLQLRQAQV